MAKVQRYVTTYKWTFTDIGSNADISTSALIAAINAGPAPVYMNDKLTINYTGGTVQKYFNQVINDASKADKYFVMTKTIDNTQKDNKAYQVYGKSGKVPVIISSRAVEELDDSNAGYLG